MKVVALAACVTACVAGDASAWGPPGHRIVCQIAFELLDAPRQERIVKLSAAYRTPDNESVMNFPGGCLFPDDARERARADRPGWARFKAFDVWHFLNVPRTTGRIDNAHCSDNCVLTGIARHAEALGKASGDPARAEALFFLGHWVGDIHQPLHVSYRDDLGGGSIRPIQGGVYESSSLHSVWDTGIVVGAMGQLGWREYAIRLAREITPAERATWIGTPPLAWAQESYNLATRPRSRYCAWRLVTNTLTCVAVPEKGRTLAQTYQGEFGDDVELRLQQAGVRLADLIRRHLVVP